MATFLVRLASNKEVVGLFVAPSMKCLYDTIDECTDPYACEYLCVRGTGGYFVPGSTKARWRGEGRNALNGGILSEYWWPDEKAKWRPIPVASS